jgi:O-antigen/teichoic acid export membrane protein
LTTPPIAPAPPSGFGSHVKNISRQSSVFLIGTVFTTLAGYFFKIYLARVLGAEALGIYALGMTVVGLAGVLAAAGLPQAASRFVAVYAATGESRKLGRFLWSALTVLLAANLLVGVLVLLLKSWIAQRLYHTPALASYLHFFVIIMVSGALTTFLGQALAGYKDVARRTIITSFIGQSLTMAFTIALLTLGFGFKGYLVAQIVSALVVLILLVRAVWQLTPQQARPPSVGRPLLEREIVSFSMALFAVQGLEFCLGQTDKVLLGIYLNAREVGIYSIAAALVSFVPLALQSVNQIFSPTIADLHARGELDLLARLFRALIKWTLGLTLPLATVIILFARPVMSLFGPEFAAGWPVLAVGTLGQLVNCGVGSVGYLLLMSGHQNKLVKIQSVMALVLVAANLLLIPRIGLLGAAFAGAAVTAVSNLWYLAEVRWSLGIRPSLGKYRDLLVPTGVMIACVLTIRHSASAAWPAWWAVFLALAVGYIVFMATSIVFLDSDDRVLAEAIWTKILGLANGSKGRAQ